MSKKSHGQPKTLRDIFRAGSSGEPDWESELDGVLRGLDDDLGSIERAIHPMLSSEAGALRENIVETDPGGLEQYERLEAAIAAQDMRRSGVVPSQQGLHGGASLVLGAWLLEDDGWTLRLNDGSFTMPLSEVERVALVLIAQARQFRVTEAAFVEAMSPYLSSAKQCAKLVRHLRSRVRAFGLSLPLLRQRDGSYRFVHRSPLATHSHSKGC